MDKALGEMIWVVCLCLAFSLQPSAETMNFDVDDWETGDMNEQYPIDSIGNANNSHVDYFYYYERVPMRMPTLDDSLGAESSSRIYDSAVLTLVVASSGLSGNDSLRLYGRQLTRNWSENGVSWNYYRADPLCLWDLPGGDINQLNCMDTLIVDASVGVYDTLYFRLDTGFVRQMIEGTNNGWLMMAENMVDRSTFMIFTEDASENYRPGLTIYFSASIPGAALTGRRRIMQNRRR